jgi:hypothetical protein
VYGRRKAMAVRWNVHEILAASLVGRAASSWSPWWHGCPVEFGDGEWRFFVVMAGPVPAIDVFTCRAKDVDGRQIPGARPGTRDGHDDEEMPVSIATDIAAHINPAAVARGRP